MMRPLALLAPVFLFATSATAQPTTSALPVHHGTLALARAYGAIDPASGAAALRAKRWSLTLAARSNGVFPESEPVLVAIGEEVFLLPGGSLRARGRSSTLVYRAPKNQRRGIRSIRLTPRIGGDWLVHVTLANIELSRLLLQDPSCVPIAIIVGDDDGFSGIQIRRAGRAGKRLIVTGACTPADNWTWLEQCGLGETSC